MSIKVMTLVWERSPFSGSKLLCHLAMADWCSDDGGSLYPSIDLLASRMRRSTSQARRTLHELINPDENGDWWIKVVGNHTGGAPGNTRRYQLNVERLKSLPPLRETVSTGARAGTGARASTDARDGWHGCASTAGTGASRTVIRTVNIPHSDNSEDPFEIGLKSWPTGFADSRREARKAWEALSDRDRTLAVDEMTRYLEKHKSIGRDHVCSFATYLSERRWEALPARPAPAESASRGKPSKPTTTKPTAFQLRHKNLYPELFGEAPDNAAQT